MSRRTARYGTGRATPAEQRYLVRRGYDAISVAYRSDDGQPASSSAEDVSRYAGWVEELASLLPSRAAVLDLGCGAGLPATRELTDRGLRVLGLDFSAVQLSRARRLVPAARLVQADMTAVQLQPGSLDAVVSFYALIHVPLADQRTPATYLRWLTAARLEPVWHRYIPEGDSGHSLILARAE
jgi:SAM-dependent methyltransferase